MIPHFHINWVGRDLDWECFATREEAQRRALELAHPEETFTIEEVSMSCPMRQRIRSGKDQSEISDRSTYRMLLRNGVQTLHHRDGGMLSL